MKISRNRIKGIAALSFVVLAIWFFVAWGTSADGEYTFATAFLGTGVIMVGAAALIGLIVYAVNKLTDVEW